MYIIHSAFDSFQSDQMLKFKLVQSFPKVTQKVAKAVFTWKVMFSKCLMSPYIWANYKINIDKKNFQKLNNLVTVFLS